MFLVCAMGTSIQASMMSEVDSLDQVLKSALENDMEYWMPAELEQIGGINEEDIHNVMRAYIESGWPVTDEMLNINDYVTRFDANKDGLVDKTEVIKLIKWFVRAIYVGPTSAENFIRDSGPYIVGLMWNYDKNGDGLDQWELGNSMDVLRMYMETKHQNRDYLGDYDFDSNGVWNQSELSELVKRLVRDFYY